GGRSWPETFEKINLVLRVAPKEGDRGAQTARKQKLIDSGFISLRDFGFQRRNGIGIFGIEFVKRRRLEAISIICPQNGVAAVERERAGDLSRKMSAEFVVAVVAQSARQRE